MKVYFLWRQDEEAIVEVVCASLDYSKVEDEMTSLVVTESLKRRVQVLCLDFYSKTPLEGPRLTSDGYDKYIADMNTYNRSSRKRELDSYSYCSQQLNLSLEEIQALRTGFYHYSIQELELKE